MKGDTDRDLYTKTQKLQNYQNYSYSDVQMEEIFSSRKEFMVQLQTFIKSDYLLQKIALIIISYRI